VTRATTAQARRNGGNKNQSRRTFREDDVQGGEDMAALLAIGTMLAIWVVVIWGSIYFNQNVH